MLGLSKLMFILADWFISKYWAGLCIKFMNEVDRKLSEIVFPALSIIVNSNDKRSYDWII